MAKPRQDTPTVTEFIGLAQALTLAAAEYAGEEFSDPEMNAMLAKVQAITSSLQAALMSAQARSSGRGYPPPPAPEPEPDPEVKHGKSARR